MFESDVISDGTQTAAAQSKKNNAFESDVISDGTQTLKPISLQVLRLRVM